MLGKGHIYHVTLSRSLFLCSQPRKLLLCKPFKAVKAESEAVNIIEIWHEKVVKFLVSFMNVVSKGCEYFSHCDMIFIDIKYARRQHDQ